jgi:hypothetical protein
MPGTSPILKLIKRNGILLPAAMSLVPNKMKQKIGMSSKNRFIVELARRFFRIPCVSRDPNGISGFYDCERLFRFKPTPTGYGLQRPISALGHDCATIALSLMPGRALQGQTARCPVLGPPHRARKLTAIWRPDSGHKDVRELARAQETVLEDLSEKRQHLQSFWYTMGGLSWSQIANPNACALAGKADH